MEHGILNCERGPINKSRISLRGQVPGSHFAISRGTDFIFPAPEKTGQCLCRTQSALASRSPCATSRSSLACLRSQNKDYCPAS